MDMNTSPSGRTNAIVAVAVTGGGALLLSLLFLAGVFEEPPRAAAAGPDPYEVKYAARASIEARTRDGDSVRYRRDFVSTYRSDEGEPVVVYCGELNAKNGFGGYAGFTRFIAGAGGGAVLLESEMEEAGDDAARLFRATWARACSRRS